MKIPITWLTHLNQPAHLINTAASARCLSATSDPEPFLTAFSLGISRLKRLKKFPDDAAHRAEATVLIRLNAPTPLKTATRVAITKLLKQTLPMAAHENQKKREATTKLETWLLKAAHGPTTPLTHADFDAIRERVKNRNIANTCRSQRK